MTTRLGNLIYKTVFFPVKDYGSKYVVSNMSPSGGKVKCYPYLGGQFQVNNELAVWFSVDEQVTIVEDEKLIAKADSNKAL